MQCIHALLVYIKINPNPKKPQPSFLLRTNMINKYILSLSEHHHYGHS